MNRVDRSRAVAQTALARAERTVVGTAARRFIDDAMSERAASLGFYALFSLIPVILIAAAALRLFGDDDTIAQLTDAARDAGASSSITQVLRDLLDRAFEAAPESAGSLGLAGVVTLLYGASKVFTDAGRALDQIHGATRVGRPLLKRAMDFGWTVGLVGCGLVLGALVFLTGGLVGDLLDAIGADRASRHLWELARWPLAAALALFGIALVNWAGPTGVRRSFRLVTPGQLVAVGLWLASTVGYSIYLANFSRYNVTYGAFAALIILMLWVWFAALSFLFGAELDAVIDERAAQAPAAHREPAPTE
jgi:membrane protein